MAIRYEVDLRDRETGNSVRTVLTTYNHDLAWDIVDIWNKDHLSDYNATYAPCEYIGKKSKQLVADCYYVEEE